MEVNIGDLILGACFLSGLAIYVGILAFCASAGWSRGRSGGRARRCDGWEKYEEKLCYLLGDGDMAESMTEWAKELAGRRGR